MYLKAVSLAAALAQVAVAHASEPPAVDVAIAYTADTVHVSGGDARPRAYYLDNLSITVDTDLDRLIGWKGGAAFINFQSNAGGMPNERAATLQGVNNIEVGRDALRVFEAWIQHAFDDRSTIRAGLYDLNSEFYATESAGLLLNPAFGIGTEFSATGSGGPSIFPSTALAVRLDHRLTDRLTARVAVLNATARTVGDPDGVDFTFDEGILVATELSLTGPTIATIGLWEYSRSQEDIRATDASGDPLRRRARGVYVMAEHPLTDPDGPFAARGFVRMGLSDGHTTPFRGGWQAGVTIARVLPGRPDGALSIGASQAVLAKSYRANLADEGIDTRPAETVFEITYADTLAPWLSIQPDLQLVINPGGERQRDSVVVPGVRITAAF